MKKSLFIILMVCLAIVGLVSCKNEIEPAQEELVSVSFENGTPRALIATLETFDVSKYYWAYEAKKNDGSGLKSGETGWDTDGAASVPVSAGNKGLGTGTGTAYEEYKVPNFSKGYWNFRLFAYKTNNNGVYEDLVYWGEVDSVLIDSSHHLASVTVSPVSGEDGYLKIGTITFVPASGISVPTDLVIYTDEVFEFVEEQWKPVTELPVEGVYTLLAGQYKFTRTYSFAGIPVANGSVIATVYSNLTTTISGTLSELTTYAEFGAEQNPDIITKTAGVDGIHKNDDVSDYYTLTEKETPAADVKVTAKVPAAAAKNLLPKDPVTEQPIADASMSLNLNVDTVDSTSTSVTYEISMTKIVTLNSEVTTSDVTTLGEDSQNKKYYATAEVKLSAGLTDVKVTHDQREMTSGQQWAAAAQMDLTPENFIAYAGTETDPDVDGYYYYYEYTEGNIKKATLYIKTNTFSPFEVTYKLTDAVAAVISKDKYTEYSSLAAAIDAAEAGETVILLSDVTSKVGYIIDKDLSIDTNGKTITVTEGSDADSHRAFKVTKGKLSVYGGGTIDAKGQATKSTGTDGTGCFGAFRAEIGTELYLKDITLKNYRPWGLNVKVLGANAELDNVKIYSVCGGGIEVTDNDGAAGTVRGYAKLTNCEMTQSEWRDWCSVAVSASGNSTVDVYSTSYEGEYGVYVFSSGGTINIYGGSFIANGTYGEAGEPKQVLKAAVDRATYPSAEARINVSGGDFKGTYAIQDSDYVKLTITGGTFDHNPSAYVAEGYIANKIATDKWEVVKAPFPGAGTKENPFVIDSAADFMKIDDLSDVMMGGSKFYFKLTRDIDLRAESFSTDYVVKYISGGLDGKKSETESYKIYAPNDSDVKYLFDRIGDFDISNIEIVLDKQSVSLVGCLWDAELCAFENVDFSSVDFAGNAYSVDHNGSMYFSYNFRYGGKGWGGNYSLKDCDVKLNLVGKPSSNSAVFVGGYANNYGNSIITMRNCTYEGTFRGNYVALVLSNGQNNGSNALDIQGLVNKGTLIGTSAAYAVGAQNHYGECSDTTIPVYYDAIQVAAGGSYSTVSVEVYADVAADGKVVISNRSESYTYTVSLYAGRLIYDSENNQWASNYNYAINFGVPTGDVYRYEFVDYDTAINSGLIDAGDCDEQGWISANCDFQGSGVYQIVNKGTAKYYVLKFTTDGNLYSKFVITKQTPTVMVCAYDSSNNLVGLKEF